MFQTNTHKTMKLILLSFIFVTGFSACSKKPSGVRATVKSEQTNLNPSVSTPADQQAAAMNANYKISTISVPTDTTAGQTVDVELLTPSGQTLPLTTRHENGSLSSEGIYNDTQRGLQVHVLASCSADSCMKYMIMVTVIKSNQALYQSIGISFKNDCKFNAASSSANVGQFLRSLQEVENKYNISPKNDIDSCSI